ncbi:MAG: ABC transporter ATP-binding protein [Vicinamibacteria bacterium]
MIDVTRSFVDGPSFQFTMDLPTTGTTVLFGPSGSGKTTLLRLLAGLDSPGRGRIAFGGAVWFDSATGSDLTTQRRHIGYVTQDAALFPHLNVRDNIGFGVPRPERSARVDEMLRLTSTADVAERLPHELSGGQKQRVALARAVAPRPLLLLLDEPLSALDAAARDALRRDLGRFLQAVAMPTVLVTHDRDEALTLGTRVALIGNGRVLQQGNVAEVFSKPDSLEAARIVGVETVIAARVLSRSNDGLATLEADGVTLTALDPGPGIDFVYACVRASEVIIEPGSAPSSARNRLPASVRAIHLESALVRVELDCGFPLTAFITRAALRDLELREGSQVSAVIKAPALHLVPRPIPDTQN